MSCKNIIHNLHFYDSLYFSHIFSQSLNIDKENKTQNKKAVAIATAFLLFN
jgi:hypothetical protein